MKSFFVVCSLAAVSISLSAQSGNSVPERPQYSPDKHCADFGYIVDHPSQGAACDQYNRDYQKALGAYEGAKNAVDHVNKLRSNDANQQIDGVTGVAKDINNRSNKNDASQFVTDKSVSLINQMAHKEKEILDNVGKSVEINTQQASPNSDSSFSSTGHTLNAETSGERGQLSLEQQFQNQASQVSSTQRNSDWKNENRSASGATLEGAFQNQESSILNSPSTVLAVARADQQRQAALEEQRIQLSRMVMQEAREEAKLKAEQQKADEQRQREIDRELAYRRAEHRAAWESARRHWMQAIGLLPPDAQAYTPGYYPIPSAVPLPLPSLPSSSSATGSKSTGSSSSSVPLNCPPAPAVCTTR